MENYAEVAQVLLVHLNHSLSFDSLDKIALYHFVWLEGESGRVKRLLEEERRLNGVLCDKTFLIAMLCLFTITSYRGIVLELLLSEVFKDERINEGTVKVQAAHL